MQNEVTAVARKRSEFEHKLNARGSTPADYARYAEYEMNLENLKKKRAKRLGVKAGRHTGHKRIFFVLDRATRKFHGDVALWMQYLQFTREQKAFKKTSQVLTSALRMHPTKPELWMYAANYAMEEQGDMTEARSYMQRGLRFCKNSQAIWLEYARLELIHMAKIAARRRILGLDIKKVESLPTVDGEASDVDHIAFPVLTAEDIDPSLQEDEGLEKDALQALDATPALSGAITIAISDAAIDHFSCSRLAERFFSMAAEFHTIPCQQKVLEHILKVQTAKYPSAAPTLNSSIRIPHVGIQRTSAAFPKALETTLHRLKSAMSDYASLDLARMTMEWITEHMQDELLDPDIRRVLLVTAGRALNQYMTVHRASGGGSGEEFWHILQELETCGVRSEVKEVARLALQIWPSQEGLIDMSEDSRIRTTAVQ